MIFLASYNKHVTGEPNIFTGIDRYNKWPVVRICKSTETKEVIKFLESFITFYGVPEKLMLEGEARSYQENRKCFVSNYYG